MSWFLDMKVNILGIFCLDFTGILVTQQCVICVCVCYLFIQILISKFTEKCINVFVFVCACVFVCVREITRLTVLGYSQCLNQIYSDIITTLIPQRDIIRSLGLTTSAPQDH